MTTTTKSPAQKPPTPPWRSQKIWAAAIGAVLSVGLILLGQVEAGVAIAGLTAAFILGRGLQDGAGAALLLVVVLAGSGCACFQAVQALSRVETEDDVWAAMPLVAECAEQAGEVLGQCRADGLGALLEQSAPESGSPEAGSP
jgi:hypothetical protein